jgi:type IV pilus assembly protein PilE
MMKMKIAKSRFSRANPVFVFVNSTGVTLIELMVVLAIMAILTLVAYPSYQQSIRKSRRSDGIAAVLAIQVAQEKFRASCVVYADEFAADNECDTAADTYTVKVDDESPEGYYAMTLDDVTGNTYTIIATAQGAQAADSECPSLSIFFEPSNPNGRKEPADCWP